MSLSPEFSGPSQKKDMDALIEFIKKSGDPAAIDQALLGASDNFPFYPDDNKLTAFFIAAKNDEKLDEILLAAAALSAPLREAVLIASRKSDRDGAFTNFFYIDEIDPMQSKVYKVIRAPQIGRGTGGWGGLKEGDDLLVSETVNREIYEEVIDAVRLLLNLEGGVNAAEIERQFDACLKIANDSKQPLAKGVEAFISLLAETDSLRKKLADVTTSAPQKVKNFTDLANDLIADLVDAGKQHLLQCRDDAHAISRGWGFKVDAYGHAAELSKSAAQKFAGLQENVEIMKISAIRKGISAVAGEMQGIHIYTLAQAPHEVGKNFYGHEAFAEIAGFAKLIKAKKPDFDTDALWNSFVASGSIGTIAKKMCLSVQDLKKAYDAIIDGRASGYFAIPDSAYEGAHREKTAQPKGNKP